MHLLKFVVTLQEIRIREADDKIIEEYSLFK